MQCLRDLFLVFLLSFGWVVGAESADSIGDWHPLEFSFSDEPSRVALQELQSKQDNALADVLSTDPNFVQAFPSIMAEFTAIGMRTVVAPWLLSSAEEQATQPSISLLIGKTIANLQAFAVGNAFPKAAPGYSENQNNKLTYRYCEVVDPNYVACEVDGEYSLNWRLARRIISSPAFVRAACPLVKDYVRWDIQWKSTLSGANRETSNFFRALLAMLDEVYGDGTWALPRMDQIQSEIDPRFRWAVIRRYMDGGPEFIIALKECVSEVMKDLDLKADPRATSSIEEMLSFKKTKSGSVSVDLQKGTLDLATFYRLSHRWSADKPLPNGIYFLEPSSQWLPFNEYLDRLNYNFFMYSPSDGYILYLRDRDLFALLQQLSILDPLNKYRTLNRTEFKAFASAGMGEELADLCLIEPAANPKGFDLYRGLRDGSVEKIEGELQGFCPSSSVRIVREPK